MTREASPVAYARFLQANEACHRMLEPVLAASPLMEAFPDLKLHRRAPSLSADLALMGLEALDAPGFSRSRLTVAQAVGVVYVLEGSRLGAGYIRAEIRRHGTTKAWEAASFAYLEGPDEPHALRNFLAAASAVLLDEADVDAAIAAADETFRYFLRVEALTRSGALN
ncbi:hypothetical protein ASG43_20135 [Aureimonas sp. Leaf454]|nr:biliverdin-producing heme oxygenase [Aureimonas sp. Leaf454]KQT52366.1 hypothetical protein ASG43_20135 [Aureimonas sp. Leaf454]